MDVGETEMFFAIAEKFIALGLTEAIDVACVDDDDIDSWFSENRPFIRRIRDHALGLRNGWASLVNMGPKTQPMHVTALRSAAPPSLVPGRTPSSSKALLAASASFTRRVIMGKRVIRPAAPFKQGSVASKASSDMVKALAKVHSVFSRFATGSPRFRSLRLDSAPVLDMQLQSYRMGSRSARVVAQRARASEAFFLDCASLQFDIELLSPFQVATWVRSRSAEGTKSAAARAACTLRCVQNATDWDLHLLHPLVRCQIMPSFDVTNAPQPAQTAKTPSVKIVLAIESLIQTGATPQLRCVAGFFTCLAYGAARFSDIQMSKDLYLTDDAITGSSFIKNKSTWTRWFCCRRGLVGDWAEGWMAELYDQDLPGTDFVLKAFNSSVDEWLQRPAEYQDLRRGLSFILHVCVGLPVDEAVLFTPHSFRHFLIDSGQQLRALKACSTDDLERLGRWSKGSCMPEKYDNASGVSELMASHTVLEALRSGWLPVDNGNLPNAFTSSSSSSTSSTSSSIMVGHAKMKRIHFKDGSKGRTRCGMWSCGTMTSPSKHAQFSDIPTDWDRCRPCGAALG